MAANKHFLATLAAAVWSAEAPSLAFAPAPGRDKWLYITLCRERNKQKMVKEAEIHSQKDQEMCK